METTSNTPTTSPNPSDTTTTNYPPNTVRLLDWALWYARNGWPIFPLKPHDKTPLTPNGFKDASTTEQQILAWWAQWPNANIGVAIPDDCLVVDVDPRHGGTLEQLAPMTTPTLMAKTGGNGYHLWFRAPGGDVTLTGNRFETLRGIDLKLGGRGYVVAPPSVHPDTGQRYTWMAQAAPFGARPVAVLPEHLVALALAEKPGSQPGQSGQSGQPGARQSQWDEDDGPIPAGERNNTLTKIAGRMRRAGMTPDELLDGLRAVNERRCQPPLDAREVGRIAESVARYEPGREPSRESGRGSSRDGRGVDAAPGTERDERARRAPASLAGLLKRQLPEVQWAVPDLIPQGATLLAGKPKVGKSWAALALALAVGTGGRAFGQLPCARGHVLYLALEDTERRLQSRTLQLLGDDVSADWDGDVDFALSWEPLDRGVDGGPTGYARLDAYLNEHADTRLVIVDTFAKIRPVEHSKNGYSYDDDYRAMGLLKRLADTHQTAFLIIHHTRKAQSDDPQDIVSGTTGLTGAVDSTMVLTRARHENEAELFMTGRDIEERSLVLQRQEQTGLWVLSETAAEELSLPEKQRAVIAFLRTQPQGRAESGAIVAAVGGGQHAVYMLLRRMVNGGSLVKPDYGSFALSDRYTSQAPGEDTKGRYSSDTHDSRYTHYSRYTSEDAAEGDGQMAKCNMGDEPMLHFDETRTRMDSPLKANCNKSNVCNRPSEPATPAQTGWLARLGWEGDVLALTRTEAARILDDLFAAKHAERKAAKRAAKVKPVVVDADVADVEAIPAIPADDAHACIACGQPVGPDGVYCPACAAPATKPATAATNPVGQPTEPNSTDAQLNAWLQRMDAGFDD